MTFTPITASQVDAESPIDDQLMNVIKENFDDHESRIIANKSFAYEFKINGPLEYVNQYLQKRKRLDGGLISAIQTLTFAKLYCERPGISGTLSVDLRKYRKTDTLITAIAAQYTGSISSINRVDPALATQSISLATPAITTQSISLFKSAINVSSIILLGSNLVRYNLASAPDSDWEVGDTVTFASCSNANNNGSFAIVRVNDDGGSNLVITNASGVAQTGAAGDATLRAYSYNYTNPVNSNFAVDELFTLASHGSGVNDGTFGVYAVNSGGNNIIVKNPSGVVQAGAGGTATVKRFVYSFTTAASTTDFVVGEFAYMTGHTSGFNNGNLTIVAVNSGGNNVVVYNTFGAIQGGSGGNVGTNRWIYALASSPSSSFTAGDDVVISGASNSNNNGTFEVKEVNRSGTDNIIIYNTSGVQQVGSGGTATHANKVLSFASDQSSVYSTSSNVELSDTLATSTDAGFYDVVQVNRGGGSNYNIVIYAPSLTAQASPAGRVLTESKSVLNSPLTLGFPASGENTKNNSWLQIASTSSMSAEAEFDATDVSNGCVLCCDLISFPTGNVGNIVIQTA